MSGDSAGRVPVQLLGAVSWTIHSESVQWAGSVDIYTRDLQEAPAEEARFSNVSNEEADEESGGNWFHNVTAWGGGERTNGA